MKKIIKYTAYIMNNEGGCLDYMSTTKEIDARTWVQQEAWINMSFDCDCWYEIRTNETFMGHLIARGRLSELV